jgi:hypothetical protein
MTILDKLVMAFVCIYAVGLWVYLGYLIFKPR